MTLSNESSGRLGDVNESVKKTKKRDAELTGEGAIDKIESHSWALIPLGRKLCSFAIQYDSRRFMIELDWV